MKSSVGIVMLAVSSMGAQWLNYPASGTPRTKDGKTNLSAPAPRTRGGQADLSGIWRAAPDPLGRRDNNVENELLPRYFANMAIDLKPGDVVLRSPGDTLFRQRVQTRGTISPAVRCVPVGVPGINTFPSPFKIVQMPKLIIILYEQDTTFRQVFMDGRPLPKDPNPSFMGYSVGRWDGDALVVESIGFKDEGWLDRMGHPHSDQMRLTERYRRHDFGHLSMEITVDDPKTYAKPLVYTQPVILLPDTDLLENFCTENEKDVPHIKVQ